MVGWHRWLVGHEFEQAEGLGDGQGSLACCSPWGRKESDTTERWTELCKLSSFPLHPPPPTAQNFVILSLSNCLIAIVSKPSLVIVNVIYSGKFPSLCCLPFFKTPRVFCRTSAFRNLPLPDETCHQIALLALTLPSRSRRGAENFLDLPDCLTCTHSTFKLAGHQYNLEKILNYKDSCLIFTSLRSCMVGPRIFTFIKFSSHFPGLGTTDVGL